MKTEWVLLWIWVIFNIGIGLYEIYCYHNRHLLTLENIPKWNSSIIASWNEYCRVDARYVFPEYEYVWYFELLNAFYAFLFLFLLLFYLYKNPNQHIPVSLVLFLLLLEVISCSLYFLTLFYEWINPKEEPTIYNYFVEKSTITNRIVYYGISGIWIIVPVYLFYLFSRK